MTGPFALDGYDVLAPLGPSGRSWRAVCLADGRPVVLRRCIGAATGVGERLAEARRRAAVWSSAVGSGVVAVRDVVREGDDLVIVSDLMNGGGLDAFAAHHGVLSAGQVVTVVVGVAEALARAHRRGLAHGRISAGNVVLDGDGRPLLADFVLAGGGDALTDLDSLVTLAADLMGDNPPPALSAALAAPTDASQLADAVRVALPAEPLTAQPTVTTEAFPVEIDRGTRNLRAVFAVAAVILVVALFVGVTWGRHDKASGSELPVRGRVTLPALARPHVESWHAIVRDLETRRVHAFLTGSSTELASVETPHTALWRHDRRTVRRLAALHEELRGLTVQVRSAHRVLIGAHRARVRIVDALSSYEVVDTRGRLIARRPARPPQAVVLVLRRDDHGWRIRGVLSPRSR